MSRPDLNRAPAGSLPDQLRALGLGDLLLGQLVQVKRRVNPSALGVGVSTLATLHALQLPGNARASSILRATVRAGGVTGELTPQAYGATPATTQISVAPNGDIVVLAADAITDMDVVYTAERGEVMTVTFPVISNVITLPTGAVWFANGVVALLAANALVGTTTGQKIVLVPGAGAPAAGQARLNIAKGTITFAAADAVTRASVTLLLGVTPAKDLQTVLDETDDFV